MVELKRTACPRDCPDACSIVAHVDGDRVLRIQGDPNHPMTRGFLCERTSRYLERHAGSDRLREPLMRVGGELRPISWEEALDVAASRLVAIREESGPAAILHYRSGGSLGLLKGVVDLFFARFGPVSVKRGDVCSGAGEAAQRRDFGTCASHDPTDLENARQIVLWGKNPYVSSVHLLPILRRCRAEIALIDPVRHRTARLASLVLQPAPGEDLALALGVARVLFDRGWVDPRADAICDRLEGFEALAKGSSLEGWAARADVTPSGIEALAERLHDRPASILVGWGMQRRGCGAAIVRALDALGAITGNLGVSGGGVNFIHDRRRAFDLSAFEADPPRRLSEPRLGREILDAGGPEIRAIWVTAGNPVAMLPDANTVAQAFESREFVVVVDTHLTDTARRASLVLPTTSFLEDDDLIGSYGHSYLGSVRPVVERPDGVRRDLEIVAALAERVGLGEEFGLEPNAWKRQLLDRTERATGVGLAEVEKGQAVDPFAEAVPFEDRRFPTSTGRVRLLDELPPEPLVPEGYPLHLLSNSTAASQASQWSGESPICPLEAICHPEAAPWARSGDEVDLVSPLASIRVRLRFDAGQRRDVVLVPKGGGLDDGTCANVLIADRTTDRGEGAAYLDTWVRLVPVEEDA